MKICFVGNIDSIHTQRWARAFAGLGHEVHVVYFGGTSANVGDMRAAGVSVHLLCTQNSDSMSNGCEAASRRTPAARSILRNACSRLHRGLSEVLSLYVIYAVRLRRLLNHIRPDVLHAWYLFDSGCMAALTGFTPLVVSAWGSDVMLDDDTGRPKWILKWANRKSLQKASVITATSNFLAEQTAHFAPKEKTIHVVPFGIDCRQFQPVRKAESNDERVWLGFAKHLLPKYGPEYLVKAFGLLAPQHPGLFLKMAGEGHMLKELKRLASELHVQDRILFCGHIPHQEIPGFFSCSDIAVMPSVYDSESFGVAALEASATGIPVVATRVGGVPEVVINGVTGLLVEPRNAKALADALGVLIENEALRTQMGRAGRDFVLLKYQWQKNVLEMQSLYEKVVRGSREAL